MPVGMAKVRKRLAAARSLPGRIPTVSPPAAVAPRQAASMTPPCPPHTTTAPASASRRPTSSAMFASWSVAGSGPITATYGAVAVGRGLAAVTRGPGPPGSPDDEVDEAPGNDDLLDDLVPVEVGLDVGGVAAQLLELLLGGVGGGLDPVANLAVYLAYELERRPLEQRRLGLGPGLLPHPAAGEALVAVGGGVRGKGEQQRVGRGQRRAQRLWIDPLA